MKIVLCALMIVLFGVYVASAALRARKPQFAVKGILTGEKLGYMLSSLAFAAKKTTRGNGMSLGEIKRRLRAARIRIGKKAAAGSRLEPYEQTVYDNFYVISDTLERLHAAKRTLRALPHVNGVPRLYSFCELLVGSVGGVVTRDTIASAVRAYSAETPLFYREIEALGDMLRFALCEYLAIYAHKFLRTDELREQGERDARRGTVDRVRLRYDSYAYGLTEGCEDGEIAGADMRRLREQSEHYVAAIAGYNARVSAAVGSLHRLSAVMTPSFEVSLSSTAALLDEEDKTFDKLSVSTRQLYLRSICRTARRRKEPERSVAAEALYRAAKEQKDIAFFLLKGRPGKAAQRGYIAFFTAAVAALAVSIAFLLPRPGWIGVLLGLPVVWFCVDFFVARVCRRVVKRRHLPSYDPQYLSEQAHSTAIVLPCFAAAEGDIEDAFRHLQTLAAANPAPLFSYCLLFDFPRADGEESESDAPLYAAIARAYEGLGPLRARCAAVVRKRKPVAGETYWQGWEKKRGALLDFNRWVLTGDGEFALRLGKRPQATYAIALDSDTLTRDCLELVCHKAHPYCADAAILSVTCKAADKATPYAKLYAGETGPGRYRYARESVGGDLFGLGNYTGKGIYDIALFTERLDGVFADNAILSHDFIEGAAAGCLDTSLGACEDFPPTFASAFTRNLRWLRGDWQLLPYVRRKIRDRAGNKRRNPVPPAAAFTILSNLVLSLVPVAQTAVLCLSLFCPPRLWLIGLAALPQLLRAVFALPALWGHARQAAGEWARCLLDLAVLPTVAVWQLCAVVVTLVRLCTRRKLLEWRVFAHAKGDVTAVVNIASSALFAATAIVFRLPWIYYGVAALFAAGVGWILYAPSARVKKMCDSAAAALADTAKQTFAYFAAQENLYRLPCDCYQEDNGKGWCARTSPTNIGMALTAYISAYELELIDKERLLAYAEKIVTAVEACEKYRGNLYNWYDCETLRVLPRRFVSSVDSGNFFAALSLLSAYTDGELRRRIDTLLEQTDLGALFDSERKLFYIGYDDEKKACTENHYDLLGSESALTYLAACGYGKVPHEAFFALDRHAVRYGGAVTVYSWTGGMFEYLMTRLFVSPASCTLYGGAMQGAVRAQIRYADRAGSRAWGVSECRYNAFDNAGGNLYRAFGVAEIAHSCVPNDPPFAPYAAFLARPYCGEKAFLRAVRAFDTAGARGEYGFYESLDGDVPVKSYMTHHQGMILAACANAIKPDCLPARLRTLPQWRAAELLCGEERLACARRKKSFDRLPAQAPMPVTGVYLCRSAGCAAVASWRGVTLDYGGKRLLQDFTLTAESGNERFSLLGGAFGGSESGVWRVRRADCTVETELTLLPSPLCAAFTVRYRNTSDAPTSVRITASAVPILARTEEYEAHPAYSRMFLQTGEEEKYVWVRRKQEGVTVLHTVYGGGTVRYSTDKCEVYGRGRGGATEQNLNPVLASFFSACVEVGDVWEFTCYYPVADTVEQAEHAVRLVSSPDCVARQKGAAERLARAVPQSVRVMAEQLLSARVNAVTAEGLPSDKPAFTREITPVSLQRLPAFVSDVRALYEFGFRFHAVLFYRAARGEFPTCRFDAERIVEQSDARAAAGGNGIVTVYECKDEQTYARLRRHTPSEEAPRRILLVGGKPTEYAASDKPRPADALPAQDRQVPNLARPLGLGGFTAEGAYAMDLTDEVPPSPWCNILSDGTVGTVMSESGGGFSFGENSRQQKFTEWRNDPVCDDPSEWIALSDGEESFSVTRKPFTVRAAYAAEHGRGYTTYRCVCGGVTAALTAFLSREESRKLYRVTIRNGTAALREYGVIFAVCPVLGDFRYNTLAQMEYEAEEKGLRLSAGGVEAYLYCDRAVIPVGADNDEGELCLYENLCKCEQYWGISAAVSLLPGEEQTVWFSLSAERPESFEHAETDLLRSCRFYRNLPRVTFDGEYGYLTEWLPYQVYNSRFAARTGFYQVSGAYGFRDQLQDCLALLYCDPALVREHILLCAAHQFKEGDVQHWWHPPAVGVRTHVCDDRLWLPYVTCAYVAQTGDKSIWEESVPFLQDVPISPQDASVYTDARFSHVKASLYEHCLRAVTVSLDFGANGLVRMRGGDWNDAMDKVGERGEGTSVWCTMFLYHVIDCFLPYAKDDAVPVLRDASVKLYAAVCAAYENDRFLRAFTDDGDALGSARSGACKIDLLTQSWSVLAGIGSSEQKKTALDTAYHLLCDEERRLIRLFDPPFTSPDGVGYIGKYPPYVRENGGQYTQAAVWYVSALFESGQTERANKLLRWLSPAARCATPEEVQTYCVEPYVSAADVYGGESAGKGGWTWYTGSAAWLYKCLIERYAGIRISGDVVTFNPQLPRDTPQLNVTIRYEGEPIRITIFNSQREGDWRVRIGEVVYNTSSLKLTKGLANKKIAVIRLL